MRTVLLLISRGGSEPYSDDRGGGRGRGRGSNTRWRDGTSTITTDLNYNLISILCRLKTVLWTYCGSINVYETRLNAFMRSCLFTATAVAAQCHSQQTNSESLAGVTTNCAMCSFYPPKN